jgi:ornithine cyclodeaminase/alanine dehydrogenase-like protein (mu-crystallin family)
MSEPVLLLSRGEIADLLDPADYLGAVEAAFRASRDAPAPPPMHIAGLNGAFHAKGAALWGERKRVALKLNGNFPSNPLRGLPTIQGVIVLCDAENGAVLAVMDSIEITLKRTAAATALAARHLARPEAAKLATCGCGAQARAHLEALAPLFRFARGTAWDKDRAKAAAFAAEARARFGFAFDVAGDLHDATLGADIVVTCTTARAPFLGEAGVSPGAFIAAVGADNAEKSEIAPALMARAKVVVDVLAQCAVIGDLHHAIKAGAMRADDIHGDLADVVVGARPGRTHADEVIIFDSTGTAILDVASAALAYERARERRVGLPFSIAS